MFKGSLKQANGYGWIRKEHCGGKKGEKKAYAKIGKSGGRMAGMKRKD